MRLQTLVILVSMFVSIFGAVNVFAEPQRPADASEVMDFCLKLQDGLQARNSPYQLDMNSCIDAQMIVSLQLTKELDENLTIIGKLNFAHQVTSPKSHRTSVRMAHLVCVAPMTMDGQTDRENIKCDYRTKMPERQF